MDPNVPIGRSGLFRNYTLPVAEGGVRKIDDHTVEMNLSLASGAFLRFLALDYVKILPKHVLEKEGDLKQAEKIIKHRAWGGMLTQGASRYVNTAPWLAIFPGIAITLIVFAVNLLGDALRDVLDHRLRGGI